MTPSLNRPDFEATCQGVTFRFNWNGEAAEDIEVDVSSLDWAVDEHHGGGMWMDPASVPTEDELQDAAAEHVRELFEENRKP